MRNKNHWTWCAYCQRNCCKPMGRGYGGPYAECRSCGLEYAVKAHEKSGGRMPAYQVTCIPVWDAWVRAQGRAGSRWLLDHHAKGEFLA